MRKVAIALPMLGCLVGLLVPVRAGAESAPTTQTTATSPVAMPAEQLLERMLQPKPGMSLPLSPMDQPADKPFLRKEGELIRQRVGRLIRDPQTQSPLFAFESDGKGLQESPVGLLAGEELAKMEDAIKRASRDLRFRITGTITLYRDKNYILVERAEIAPDLQHP